MINARVRSSYGGSENETTMEWASLEAVWLYELLIASFSRHTEITWLAAVEKTLT